MTPTVAYLSAPEVSRSRSEMSHGDVQVVVENIPGQSSLYVSHDRDAAYTAVPWTISIWSRVLLKLRGRTWPPTEVHVTQVTSEGCVIRFCDMNRGWGEFDYLTASLVFKDGEWRIRW